MEKEILELNNQLREAEKEVRMLKTKINSAQIRIAEDNFKDKMVIYKYGDIITVGNENDNVFIVDIFSGFYIPFELSFKSIKGKINTSETSIVYFYSLKHCKEYCKLLNGGENTLPIMKAQFNCKSNDINKEKK